MEFESKVLSKEIQQVLYDNGKTLGTAESCTGGRIAEAIIATPGASNYFKGGIICYTNEVKERLLTKCWKNRQLSAKKLPARWSSVLATLSIAIMHFRLRV
mgnify:CR=1 FL=1